MSEPPNVRLVRCPRCGNLLPELTDYSAYRCGGCGTVLRADDGKGVVDPFFENSSEERVQGFSGRLYEKSENLVVSEMSKMNIVHVAEDDIKSNSSSSSRAERRRFENQGPGLMTTVNRWVADGVMEIDDRMKGSSHAKFDLSYEEARSRIGNENGLQRSGEQWDRRFGGINEMDGFPRPPRTDVVGTSYSTPKYLEEGPLKYQLQGSYGYREPLNKRNDLDAADNVGFLGEDRAEILRKLEELKLQLIRSGDMADKPKEKFPPDRRIVPPDGPYPYGYSEDFFPAGYSAMNRRPVPYSIPDHQAARPAHGSHYTETSPFVSRHGYFPPHSSGHVQEYGDPSSSQFLPRGSYQAPGPFQQKPPRTQFAGTYADGNMVPVDSYDSHPPSISRHHPSCSCFHCLNQYQNQVQVPSNAYGAKQLSTVSEDPAFYRHDYKRTVGLQDYGEMHSHPSSFKSSNSVSHRRWPSDLKSEASSFVRNRPAKVLVITGRRQCQPVAGGAPFLACQNCHQLLLLPKKVFLSEKPTKMKCGACSASIEVTVSSKSLNVTVNSEANRTTSKFNLGNEDSDEWSSENPGNPNKAGITFASDDFDSSAFNFQSMDGELVSAPTGAGSSNKSADLRSSHSTSPSSSDKEQSFGNMSASRNNSNVPKSLAKGIEPPPPAGSPLQDHFDYSNKFHVHKRFENGSRSGRSEMDKMTPVKTTLRQDSMNDTSATEIEISSNEYANTGTSLESGEASREGDRLRANKAAQSFFGSIIKKSFKESNRSIDEDDLEEANVTVNGNLISARLVKKAERLAGPIRPGHYWYDFRAGFWGVIGGPCLGILPPFIEEFNYSMLENCAGGSTGVLVNGRELHPKDLKLLASRGLPIDRNRSFILEISGRILDADTGEELISLGKLAPTIEKLKRGFGMKDPNAAAV